MDNNTNEILERLIASGADPVYAARAAYTARARGGEVALYHRGAMRWDLQDHGILGYRQLTAQGYIALRDMQYAWRP